jgi:hypothetical protein
MYPLSGFMKSYALFFSANAFVYVDHTYRQESEAKSSALLSPI